MNNMTWLRFIAWLTGKHIVLLHDFDGEITIRLATKVKDYLITTRHTFGISKVALYPGGKVGGCEYVVKWEYLKNE